jgi:hypothetical protein
MAMRAGDRRAGPGQVVRGASLTAEQGSAQ